MCEHFIARAAEPFRLDALWPFAEKLERFGIAGFGWGAAWLGGDGRLGSYRDLRAFRDDPGREGVGAIETTAALVHLRRPSRLSTLTLPDTQPFDDPARRYAFSHNGDLRKHKELRATYRAQGRIHGRADTEVGARWLEDAWDDGHDNGGVGDRDDGRDNGGVGDRDDGRDNGGVGDRDDGRVPHLLAALHDRFGGQANLAVLEADGTPHQYAGNGENPVFTFRLGQIGLASTGIYSLDRSLFRFVAPKARDRRLIRVGTTVTIDRRGAPSTVA